MSNARAVKDELEKILASSVFANSPRMRRFLAFVVEETSNGRASQIKEYSIALEVFDKPSDYDPRTDSTVRTEATKLRARLARYYAEEGPSDTLVISLPKGTYVPVFREFPTHPPTASDDSLTCLSAPQPASSINIRKWRSLSWTGTFAVTVVLLSIAIIAGINLDSWIQLQRKLVRLEAQGSVLMDTWTYEDIYRGIDCYRQIVSLDPKSASAYSKIATGYLLLSDLYMAPREAMPKAALAARQALELNRQLSDPHVALGMVKLQFDWDWPGAEKELKRAIALEPSNPVPHQQYGWYLMSGGRFSQASGEMKYAIALDSSSDFSFWELGLCQYFARQFEDATEQARRAIALEPKSYWPHMLLGWAMEEQGRFDEAIGEMTIASQLTDSPQAIAALAHAQGVAGRRKESERLLEELTALSKRRYVSPYDLATVYAGNADTEQTLTFLEKACEERSGWLPLWLKVDPKFNRVRGQARFSALLKRVGSTIS